MTRLVTITVVYLTLPLISALNNAKGIVSGFNKPVEPSDTEHPYHASLLAQRKDGAPFIFCGGSLIHPRWILSAAHCLEQDGKQFPPSFVKVSLGSVRSDLAGAQIRDVVNTIIHENYYDSGGEEDVGLLELTSPASLSKFIKVISLYPNESLTTGETAYLTGLDFYRRPSRLRRATLHVADPKKCLINREYYTKQICCTSTVGEGKACKGDSGGALVIMTRYGKLYQIGIASHLAVLPICKVTFNHSVYAKVSAYLKWISQITAITFDDFNKSQ